MLVNNSNNIMVCVTQQKTCERLINKGGILKNKINSELFVIHVAKEGTNFLGNSKDADAIECLYDASRTAGAEMTVIRSNDIIGTLVSFSKQKGIGHIVMGEAPLNIKDKSINSMLEEELSGVEFYIIPSKELE